MSRCFPFPPPGYEKKARSDDFDLLKKEDKEKKNKEKKDKEKKEKDRSDGKHRDKKDKKEKHREKKEKDRDKDKDKSSASDEKRLLGQAVHNNGGDRASDERKVPGQSNGGEVCTQKRKERDHDKNSISGNKNNPGQFSVCNGQKLIQTSNVSHQLEESKFVQQLGKRAREEDRKQFFEKLTSTDAKRDEGMVRLVAKVPGNWVEGKEKNKRDDDRTVDGQGIKDEARFTASPQRISKAKIDGMPISLEKDNEKKMASMPISLEKDNEKKMASMPISLEKDNEKKMASMPISLEKDNEKKMASMPISLEKDNEKKMEGKEKTKQKESDDKRKNREKKSKEKDKVRDREKKSREKDKVRDKEKKKEEKAKEKNEHKMKEPVKLKENNMFDLVLDHTVKSSHLIKESTNSVINIKKRKDSNANGLLHADDIKPNKLPRPTSSLPVSVENGRMLGTCQIPTSAIQGRQEAVNSDKVDSKEQKINGLIEAVAPPITSTNHLLPASLTKSLTKPSNSTAQTDQIAEVSRKQPHPDSKYLLEVLTVPKMEDWSDFEDQEWLFQSTYSQTKKPQVEVSGVDETQQVWSEALQIESADVYALPYVIPY